MPLQATPKKQYVYPGNTNMINVEGLIDERTGNYLNAATLNATLYDDNDNAVTGCIDIALTYTPGSNGDYVGSFGDVDFNPPLGTGYNMVIKGSEAGAGITIQTIVEVTPRQQ